MSTIFILLDRKFIAIDVYIVVFDPLLLTYPRGRLGGKEVTLTWCSFCEYMPQFSYQSRVKKEFEQIKSTISSRNNR